MRKHIGYLDMIQTLLGIARRDSLVALDKRGLVTGKCRNSREFDEWHPALKRSSGALQKSIG